MSHDAQMVIFYILSIVGLFFIVWTFPGLFTSEEKTINTLNQAGYEKIQTTGYGWFSCGNDDWYSTKFKAQFNNHSVNGTVCCGLIFKNCTIRYN